MTSGSRVTFVFCLLPPPPGEYYLFCKGADSAIFPRIVSGKVEQVRARVEHNAVVSTAHMSTHRKQS